jgi:SAM-dependent methyltransferase
MARPERRAHRVVRRGYDEIGARYLEWRRTETATKAFLEHALELLPEGGSALDLGCGPGYPVTTALARRGRVVGVDLSMTQLDLARRRTTGQLVQADITEVAFRPGSFDLIAAFYCLNHVPRGELDSLLAAIRSWLKPGGAFVGSFGVGDDPGTVEEDWLGAPMFFSSFDRDRTLTLLSETGLELIREEVMTQQEHGAPTSFLWVVCRGLDLSSR